MDYELGWARLLPSANPVRGGMEAAGGRDRAGLDTRSVVDLNHISVALRAVAVVVVCGSYVLLLLPLTQDVRRVILDTQFTIIMVLVSGMFVCALRMLIAMLVTGCPGRFAPRNWDILWQSPLGVAVAWLLLASR